MSSSPAAPSGPEAKGLPLEAFSHPWCRIPPLTPGQPWIPSEKGLLRPERALAYNRPELLLHGPASTRPGHNFSAAELAGYSKTCLRLLAIADVLPWATIAPLEWNAPEELLFTCENDPLLADLASLWNLTQQAESFELLTLNATHTALVFRRC